MEGLANPSGLAGSQVHCVGCGINQQSSLLMDVDVQQIGMCLKSGADEDLDRWDAHLFLEVGEQRWLVTIVPVEAG